MSERESTPDSTRWRFWGLGHYPKSEVVYFVQVIIIYVVIITSIVNLTLNKGDGKLWTALLSSCLGYILPNPSLKKKPSAVSPKVLSKYMHSYVLVSLVFGLIMDMMMGRHGHILCDRVVYLKPSPVHQKILLYNRPGQLEVALTKTEYATLLDHLKRDNVYDPPYDVSISPKLPFMGIGFPLYYHQLKRKVKNGKIEYVLTKMSWEPTEGSFKDRLELGSSKCKWATSVCPKIIEGSEWVWLKLDGTFPTEHHV